MYRDDLEATHARVEALQRDLSSAQSGQIQDKQRIADLTAQLAAMQQELSRLGGAFRMAQYILPSRANTVLVLGILSLVLCSIMGPIAWSMGSEELRRIDSGQVDPLTRGTATAGRICGIVGTVFLIIGAFFAVWMMSVISSAPSYY